MIVIYPKRIKGVIDYDYSNNWEWNIAYTGDGLKIGRSPFIA